MLSISTSVDRLPALDARRPDLGSSAEDGVSKAVLHSTKFSQTVLPQSRGLNFNPTRNGMCLWIVIATYPLEYHVIE